MLHTTIGLSAVIMIIIARIVIGLFYVLSAVIDTLQWKESLQLMEMKKIPFRPIFLPAEIALKLLGGLAIVFNFYLLLFASALIAFTLTANIIFNTFWTDRGKRAQLTFIRFFSYLAIVSGLLLLIAVYL